MFYFLQLVILVFAGSVLFGCQGPESSYFQIRKTRAVAAVFQNSPLVSGSGLLLDSTASQQFPLRLRTSSTSCANTHLYFVVLSPSNEIPALSFQKITVFPLGSLYLSHGGGARGAPFGTQGKSVAVTDFFGNLRINTVQTDPFRVTVFDYQVMCDYLTLSNLESFINRIQDIPGFLLNYTASSLQSQDQGFFSFYFLPEPTDVWWNAPPAPLSLNMDRTDKIKNGLAVTNNPLQITGLMPNGNQVFGQQENALTLSLNSPVLPPQRNSQLFQPRQRIQWYVSHGNLLLDTAAQTRWNPDQGPQIRVGGFVVVRDLLGGIDFKLLGPFATQ